MNRITSDGNKCCEENQRMMCRGNLNKKWSGKAMYLKFWVRVVQLLEISDDIKTFLYVICHYTFKPSNPYRHCELWSDMLLSIDLHFASLDWILEEM